MRRGGYLCRFGPILKGADFTPPALGSLAAWVDHVRSRRVSQPSESVCRQSRFIGLEASLPFAARLSYFFCGRPSR